MGRNITVCMPAVLNMSEVRKSMSDKRKVVMGLNNRKGKYEHESRYLIIICRATVSLP